MKKYIQLSILITICLNLPLSANKTDKKIEKLEKSLKQLKKSIAKVKAHDAKDNIKFSVDFRTSLDSIKYETTSGKTYKNSSIFSNRLWLNLAYAPSKNMVFRGQLAYNKAYGASPKMLNNVNQRGNSFSYDVFDWITNESLTDDTIRLKEAYWLYMNDTFFGKDIGWTASFGRRPSTNGFLVNLRDNDEASSPLGHIINMEFDGASFKFKLDKLTGIDGMSWKACFGRGLTNARARFNLDSLSDSDITNDFYAFGDYTKDENLLKDIDLAGFVFVPFDDGQYEIKTTYYRAFNVPGFIKADSAMLDTTKQNIGMMKLYDTNHDNQLDTIGANPHMQLKNLGDMDGAAISLLVDGLGDGINDFLDDTKFFASFAWSRSLPDNKQNSLDLNSLSKQMHQLSSLTQAQKNQLIKKEGILGSNDNETGTSYWFGFQWPCLLVKGARVGAEYNHGSKYWRPFTYGEDTLVGSKLATRGDAYELYWIKQLLNSFSMQIRYTQIEYNYTGSQGFFGSAGTPISISKVKLFGIDAIKNSKDLRISFSYKF